MTIMATIRHRAGIFSEEEKEETLEDQSELDWKSFSVILMRALMPFAEAKAAVLAAFRDVEVCPSPT